MENKGMFEVSFGNDSQKNYHLNVLTSIQLGLLENDELWLSTISVEEAMLICVYFTKKMNIVNNTFKDLISVECESGNMPTLFVFKYPNNKIAMNSLANFVVDYRQIYDEFSEDENINSINEIWRKSDNVSS